MSRRARRADPDDVVRGRPHLPVQEGLRVPGVGSVDRPRGDRRRRRVDRPHRPVRAAQGRAGVVGRRARSGVVRSRRHAAGGHRRRRRARLARPGCVPRRRHAARWNRCRRPPSATVGDRLGLDTIQAAAGVFEIVNQNMAAAARMHAVEHGVDLRGVAVLAFGGAGPVHACGVAELLDSDRVVFPVNASVLSAFGTLVSPVRIDLARSMPRPPRRHRRHRTRCDARRAAHRRAARARRRGSVAGRLCASATGSTPATPARATRSRCWIGEGRRDGRPATTP